jgi:ubiquinol-cytochrome c reductase cytochrome c1 subunit
VHQTDEKTGNTTAVQEVSTFDAHGNKSVTRTPLKEHKAAEMTVTYTPLDVQAAKTFDSDVADLVAYLNFMTEPGRTERMRIGRWVMLLLFAFAGTAWWLNRVFWKDIK